MPVPCETSAGCKKGHWRKPIEIKPHFMKLLNLYDAVRATSGACLSEEQRGNVLLMRALAMVDSVARQGERMALASIVRSSVLSSVVALKGPK